MAKISDSIRKFNHHFCSAVILAAGDSRRFGQDKLTLDLGGRPLLAVTLSAFQNSETIDEIIVVTRPDRVVEIAQLCKDNCITKATKVVIGGSTRTESALAGVSETSKKVRIICIHDGARPFVPQSVIADAAHNAVLYTSAAPALPVKNTVKQTSGDGFASDLPREMLFSVQTPQTFEANIIKAALTAAVSNGISYTDDCAAVEALGVKTKLFQGSEENIKITTPLDAALAAAIVAERKGDSI